MMDGRELLLGRRSVRSFEQRPVEAAVLEEIVSDARYAPSWKNTQTVRYTAILDEKTRLRIADSCVMGFALNQQTIRSAPALVMVTSIKGRSGYERDGTFSTGKGEHWQSFDAGAAVQTFCLSAWLHGLGTVILGIFDEDRLKECVRIPENEAVSALVAIGYPGTVPAAPGRKDTAELLRILSAAERPEGFPAEH